jgi:hypothetical protein
LTTKVLDLAYAPSAPSFGILRSSHLPSDNLSRHGGRDLRPARHRQPRRIGVLLTILLYSRMLKEMPAEGATPTHKSGD